MLVYNTLLLTLIFENFPQLALEQQISETQLEYHSRGHLNLPIQFQPSTISSG